MIGLLLACGGPEDPPGKDREPPEPELTTLAEDAGYLVQVGEFAYSDYERCCDPGVSCLWNNPTTPYGVYGVPAAPGEVAGTEIDGFLQTFRLRGDEALVLLGRTPPPSRYFSWRSYLAYRVGPEGAALPVLGSLGPSLNHQVVAERHGEDALFDAPFAIVTTADAVVERQVTDWLVATGWDPAHVHADRIPAELVRLGLGAEADTFSVVSRVAVYDDPAAGEAWLEDPGATVLRLTPQGEPRDPVEPHPPGALPPMGSGTDEQAWRPAVDRLEAAIRAAFPGFTGLGEESNAWHFETYDCIELAYCSGEIRDRYYARVPNLLLPGDGSFAVAFGTNHERTGKASYANVSVSTVENQVGIASVESDGFVGSARAFLPDDPQVDDLYAVIVARSCEGFPDGVPCLEVPTEECPGVELDEPLLIDFRAYVEPATGAAPLAQELVADRAIKFFP